MEGRRIKSWRAESTGGIFPGGRKEQIFCLWGNPPNRENLEELSFIYGAGFLDLLLARNA